MKDLFIKRSDRDYGVNWSHCFLFVLLFFTTQMDFRSYGHVVGESVDLQVIIRVLILCGLTAWAMLFVRDCMKVLLQVTIILHVLHLIYLIGLTSMPDVINVYSLYTLLTHLMVFFVIIVMVMRFGVNHCIFYYFVASVVMCAVSLFYYYYDPSVGRYIYWLNDVLFTSPRFKGVAGHPNTLGFMLAVAVLAFLHCKFTKYPMPRWCYIAILMVIFGVFLTNNRVSIGGMILMVGLYTAIQLRIFSLMVGLGVAAIIFVLVSLELSWGVVPELLTMASRSGDLSEITTMTGRSHIWRVMGYLIEQKPLFGWGFGPTRDVLLSYADEIGFMVGQAHNMYLQTIFSGGFIGLFLLMAGILYAMFIAFIKARHGSPFEIVFFVFALLTGMTEAVILNSIPTNSYLLVIFCFASLAAYARESKTGQYA